MVHDVDIKEVEFFNYKKGALYGRRLAPASSISAKNVNKTNSSKTTASATARINILLTKEKRSVFAAVAIALLNIYIKTTFKIKTPY